MLQTIVHDLPQFQALKSHKRHSSDVRDLLEWSKSKTIQDIMLELRSLYLATCGVEHEQEGACFTQYECPLRKGNLCCGHTNDPYMFPFQDRLLELQNKPELTTTEQAELTIILQSTSRTLVNSQLTLDAINYRLACQRSFFVRILNSENKRVTAIKNTGLHLADLDVAVRHFTVSSFKDRYARFTAMDEAYNRGYKKGEGFRIARLVSNVMQQKMGYVTHEELVTIFKGRQKELGVTMSAYRDQILHEFHLLTNNESVADSCVDKLPFLQIAFPTNVQ